MQGITSDSLLLTAEETSGFLTGDTADSPIVEQEIASKTLLLLGYRFRRSRDASSVSACLAPSQIRRLERDRLRWKHRLAARSDFARKERRNDVRI
jgi:hypothetical protein